MLQSYLNFSNFNFSQLLRIVFILLAGLIAQRALKLALSKIGQSIEKADHSTIAQKKYRIKTLQGVISNTGSIVIWSVVVFTLLSELGVNIGPLIAGAGIVGFGVGFGSQTLVRDFISGFFILFENQFNRGDVVEIAGKQGEVEQINLRTTVLKDEDGNIHIIPNSQIKMVSRLAVK